MNLRRFTPDGIQAFREYLAQNRMNSNQESPNGLLESRLLTEVIESEIQIAANHFSSKGEAAHYLKVVLSSLEGEEVTKDAGLWSWLSLFFFDSICPDRNGQRVVRNDYHYVFEPHNVRHYYRHLLFISWRVLHLAPVHNRLFLHSSIGTLDKVTTEVMKRLYLTRIPCMFEVLDRLYWDEINRRPRSGITASREKPGDLTHRLPLRIRQLEKTYDLMSLTSNQLLELLGEEFSFARPPSRTLFPESVIH